MVDFKNVLVEIVKPIVTKPDEVKVEENTSGSDVLLQLSVSPEDMGKVIGRHGKIAKAIRTVMKAAAASSGCRVRVDILDSDERADNGVENNSNEK